MRQIVLDTETTGLDPSQGHRILELACVELDNRQRTQKHVHFYINPERESDEGALRVHGITSDFLADKPKFPEIVDTFLDFVQGAELIIHNAAFDVGFLDAELLRCGREKMRAYCPEVLDTLLLARELRPGKRNNLDALCRDYEVDNSGRTLHGALLDADLLADVYLRMTRGQESLSMETEPIEGADGQSISIHTLPSRPLIQQANETEQAAHAAYLAGLEKANKSPSRWAMLQADIAPRETLQP